MRQILLFALLAASLALLIGCGAAKDKPEAAKDMPDKAAYQKISAEEAYEMMAGILKTPFLCPTRESGVKCPRRCPIRRRRC